VPFLFVTLFWISDFAAKRRGKIRKLRALSYPFMGEIETVRGGSWNNNARNCRVSNRNRNEPDNRNHNYGFRLACLHFPLMGHRTIPDSSDSWIRRAWRKS